MKRDKKTEVLTKGNEKSPMQIEHIREIVILVMGIVLLLTVLASFLFGRYPVPAKELAGIIWKHLGGAIEPFWTGQMETAVWNVRLPRIFLGVMVGCCLSAAGAAYQGVFQNPMASPDILGASAGAGFGAALGIMFGFHSAGITLSAFLMSMLTVALVFHVSRYAKGDKILGLILAGIMISSLFQSGTSFIKLVADPNNKLPQITYWLMGSLSGAKWSEIRFALFPVAIGMVPLVLLRWRFNVLAMGDEEAHSMGVNPQRIRLLAIICSTLLTASAVSVSGMIGWVGLVIPHMMRRIVGSDYRYLMPASMLGGGIFLLIVDNVSRNVSTSGIPIGILTAFIGAPFFLWLITGRGDTYGH